MIKWLQKHTSSILLMFLLVYRLFQALVRLFLFGSQNIINKSIQKCLFAFAKCTEIMASFAKRRLKFGTYSLILISQISLIKIYNSLLTNIEAAVDDAQSFASNNKISNNKKINKQQIHSWKQKSNAHIKFEKTKCTGIQMVLWIWICMCLF